MPRNNDTTVGSGAGALRAYPSLSPRLSESLSALSESLSALIRVSVRAYLSLSPSRLGPRGRFGPQGSHPHQAWGLQALDDSARPSPRVATGDSDSDSDRRRPRLLHPSTTRIGVSPLTDGQRSLRSSAQTEFPDGVSSDSVSELESSDGVLESSDGVSEDFLGFRRPQTEIPTTR